MQMQELIHIVPNLLSEDQCDHLMNKLQSSKNILKETSADAFTGVFRESTFDVVSLEPDEPEFDIILNAQKQMIQSWMNKLESMNSFNLPALRKLCLYTHDQRLLRYQVGGKIHPHTDWNHGTHASCTIALNDESEYEGGDFCFWGGKHKVRLKKGSAMIFPADPYWVHEVSEITSGVRYSTNSFICSVPYSVSMDVSDHMLQFSNCKDDPWFLGS